MSAAESVTRSKAQLAFFNVAALAQNVLCALMHAIPIILSSLQILHHLCTLVKMVNGIYYWFFSAKHPKKGREVCNKFKSDDDGGRGC